MDGLPWLISGRRNAAGDAGAAEKRGIRDPRVTYLPMVESEHTVSTCPSCGAPVGETSRFCPSCGTSLDISDSPTGTAPRRVSPAPGGPRRDSPTPTRTAGLGSPAASERFAPGSVLGGRYRILGLLGRGGMGEVYRADDLKLEQPVALKFLPTGLEADTGRLERFFGEVRMARQVSHPAVCRVWDIGEADGQHFLSMEFVDGENLASLLRRIGRLPQDKALDIAKQVCAGLAAAHQKGVLHRDLKPANVMLDEQGKVRITDFGLAGLAEVLTDEDVRSGTPSFMSPEQLLGREVTVRSDVYALGLLLYELFTGRRAFSGRTLAELTRKHRSEHPIDPSLVVPGLDPTIERAILACLEKEPRKRPPSALAVSAMLSGQDPLEAAIAAGDTPSPELVAAAGEAETLPRSAAMACLGTVLLAVLLAPLLWHSQGLINVVPIEKPPAVLEDRARELVGQLGHRGDVEDSEIGFRYDHEYFRHLQNAGDRPSSWDDLRSGRPAVLQLWYRQSPRPLVSLWSNGRVSWGMPPPEVSGMAGVVYDLRGQLLEFYRVPPQVEEVGEAAPPPDWSPLFTEAQLDPSQLSPAAPEWSPPFYCDARAAWTGHWPERPDIPIRVEAAAHRGQPVWFRIVQPWTRPERMQRYEPTAGQRAAKYFGLVIVLVLIGVGAALARRNLILGRGDRRGAFRLAMAYVAVGFGSLVLSIHHVADVGGEMSLLARGTGIVVLLAALLWLFYLALEPYVRRLRPSTLVSWTRFLDGGLGDGVVGRDLLIGATWGAVLSFVAALANRLPAWLGQPVLDPAVLEWSLGTLLGLRPTAATLLELALDATLTALGALLLYLILRLVLRRDLPAALALVAVTTALSVVASSDPLWLTLPLVLALTSSYVFMLLRFGLLPTIGGWFVYECLCCFPLTMELGAWYAGPTMIVLPFVALLAVLTFRAARGGSELRRYLAGEMTSGPG
jgi:hypothetical protein